MLYIVVNDEIYTKYETTVAKSAEYDNICHLNNSLNHITRYVIREHKQKLTECLTGEKRILYIK